MADRSVVIRLIADTNSLEQGMGRGARAVRSLNREGKATLLTFGGLGKIATEFAIGGIVKAGIDFDALKQRSQAAFTTITGSGGQAKRLLDSLYGTFKNNPFGYPQMLKSSQQLLAMGVNAKDLVREVRDISDATAAVGGNADLLDRVALAIGQMSAKGTVQAEEMRQLAENGIPAWQLLAHEIGVSVPEAMKMVQKREVDSQQGVDALLRGIESRFGGATDRLKNTWTGTLTAFKTEAVQAGGEIVKPIMRIGTDGMHAIQPLLHTLGQLGTEFADMPTPAQNTTLALAGVMLMSGRLNSVWSAGRGTLRGFSEQMALSQALARASGQSLGTLGAAASAARIRMAGLGSSVINAFGGPIGVAIIGATFLLSNYQKQQQDAAAAVARHKAEVDSLTSALDRNTLQMTENGRAQLDEWLTSKGSLAYDPSKSISDMAGKYRISLDLIRQMMLGSKAAEKAYNDYVNDLDRKQPEWYKQIHNHDAELADLGYSLRQHSEAQKEAAKQIAEAMRLAIPDAANKANVSISSLRATFDQWARSAQGTKGDTASLRSELAATGMTASQVSTIMRVLAGDATNAAYSFGNAATAWSTTQKSLQTAAGGFVSVTGAWDSAQQQVQAAADAGGSGGTKKTPRVGDDPAYRAAKKAYDAQQKQMREARLKYKDHIATLRDTASASRDAASAADKHATAMKKAADRAHEASLKARDALKDAKVTKGQADRDAQDAAAIAAAIRQQAGRAGTADATAWKLAQEKATKAVHETATAQKKATLDLAKAREDVTNKHNASVQAREDLKTARQDAAAKRRTYNADEKALKAYQHVVDVAERAAERTHEKLLAAKNKAEQRAQAKTEAATKASGAAYGGLAAAVKPSLDQYLDQLQRSVTAQIRWKDNLIALAARVPPGIALQLAKMGPSAAPLVQELVDGTDAQLKKFVSLFGHTGDNASKKLSQELGLGIPLIAAVGKQLGEKAASKLAKALRDGKTTISDAITALQGHMNKKTLQMTLAIKNKAVLAQQLDDLLHHRIYKLVPWNGPGGQKGFQVGSVKGYAEGGWIKGGSGRRDDVPVPFANRRGGVMAMGGEFMVKRSLAQRFKPFFDEMHRTGRMPTAAASAPAPHIVVMPAPAPSRDVNQYVTIYQLPGQSAGDLVREMDRQLGLGVSR